jgi:hypothetical protein
LRRNRTKAQLEQALARFERTQKDFTRAQEEGDTHSADQREAEEAVQAARAAVEAETVEAAY